MLSLTVHCHLVNLLGKETVAGKEMLYKKATALTVDFNCQMIMGAWRRKVDAPASRAMLEIMKSTPWSGTHKQSHCPGEPSGKSSLGEAICDSTGLSGSTESARSFDCPLVGPMSRCPARADGRCLVQRKGGWTDKACTCEALKLC